MTREQFVSRWKKHLAGLALYGHISETRDGTLTRAAKVLEIPAEVEKLLGQLYDDATKQEKETTPSTNGKGANHAAPPQEAKPR